MAATANPLVWFITGSSAGLGAALAIHALKSGHKVIAAARNITTAAKANPEITSLGGHWVALDVTSLTSGSVIEEATKVFGRIDVLVNNAGFSILGATEDITEEEAQAQFATNFFGPLRLIRSILPSFRAQKSGTIVNITSVAGYDGLPTCGLYAGSKFALEGLSESLALEVAPFNIRVLLVEPGAFRTRFLSAASASQVKLSSSYVGTTVDNTLQAFNAHDGKQRGDPVKGVSKIFDVVTKSGAVAGLEKEYLRFPVGVDAIQRLDKKIQNLKDNVEALRSFGTTDIDV